ncbi:MAG: hypothetical protein GXP49_06315 [Deltaproteobacteria bacterium]|nr:hypothetical protein [Deltaproteobacteria bacterium]
MLRMDSTLENRCPAIGKTGRILNEIRQADPGFAGRIYSLLGSSAAFNGYDPGHIVGSVHDIDLDADLDADLDIDGEAAAERIGEALLLCYSLREQYMRKVDNLDKFAGNLSSETAKIYKEMVTRFIADAFKKIVIDLENDHKWYTGFKDSYYIISSTFSNGLAHIIEKTAQKTGSDRLKGLATDLHGSNKGGNTLLEQIFKRHFSEEIIRGFKETLSKDLERDLAQRWQDKVQSINKELQIGHVTKGQWAAGSTYEEPLKFISYMDDPGMKWIIRGIGTSAVSTLMLAAGWHTMQWALTNLFLPLLPVVAGASALAAKKNEESTLNTIKEELNKQKDIFITIENEYADYKLRFELENLNAMEAQQVKTNIFRIIVGSFDMALLNELIQNLEEVTEEIWAVSRSTGDRSGPSHSVWLDRARSMLEADDELAAAMYGSLVFEQLLRDMNRTMSLGFDFKTSHHNSRFLYVLETRNLLDESGVSDLRSLKARRDMFTHRMHQVAVMSAGKRKRMVQRFLRDLEKAGRLMVPG